MTYTEKDISEAYKRRNPHPHALLEAGDLLAELKEKNRAPGFADDDTITVKELRAGARAAGIVTEEILLRWISEHREPEYPFGSVWRDADCKFWFRTHDKKWLRFGVNEKFSHESPKRPLKRMDA